MFASQIIGSDSLVSKRPRVRRLLCAKLLKRTFGVDPEECSDCGRQMNMIATIMHADVAAERREAELDRARVRSPDRAP